MVITARASFGTGKLMDPFSITDQPPVIAVLTSRFSSSVELVPLVVLEWLHTTEDVKVGALTLISSQPLLGI